MCLSYNDKHYLLVEADIMLSSLFGQPRSGGPLFSSGPL